jgi:pimeloyl-ACP methyl ester carboxylesterase
MKIVLRALLVLIALPALAAVAGVILAPTVLHPFHRRLTAEQIRKSDEVFAGLGAVREEFGVRAPDGADLHGWKVRAARPNSSWVLLLHGRSHNRFVMLSHAEFLLAAGYNVLMMDARDHGESGGTMSTYGYLEKRDATAIVDRLESSEDVKHLFALGESMGAAVSLQSAAAEPRIEAVVAEGAFKNLREVTYDYAGLQESATLGKTLFRPAADVSRRIVEKQVGFMFESVSPEDAVAARAFPVLLICGASDRKIPCRHGEAIYRRAAGRKELWRVPDTGHGKAINTHGPEFQKRVLTFFEEAGKSNARKDVLTNLQSSNKAGEGPFPATSRRAP